jgi:hypothetical protein
LFLVYFFVAFPRSHSGATIRKNLTLDRNVQQNANLSLGANLTTAAFTITALALYLEIVFCYKVDENIVVLKTH